MSKRRHTGIQSTTARIEGSLAACQRDASAQCSAMRDSSRDRKILLVEDDVDTARSFAELLGTLGYSVAVEHSGGAAMVSARVFRPDVVLCDLGLPDTTGFEVVRRMRNLPDLARVWMIAVSGYATDADRSRATAAGFDAHLTKPLDFSELEKALATASEKRNLSPESCPTLT